MKQKYKFFDGGTLEFDDAKSVKELLEYAFDKFDYYEPMGMDIVTLFQAHHQKTNTGWITTDVTLSCADEIYDRDWLCFAYHMPGVFYFAEGGWGHHMPELGNRPMIPNEISLYLRFEDFKNTIIINGDYTFGDIVRTLKESEYIDDDYNAIRIEFSDGQSYRYSFSNPIMETSLTEFINRDKMHKDNSLNLSIIKRI